MASIKQLEFVEGITTSAPSEAVAIETDQYIYIGDKNTNGSFRIWNDSGIYKIDKRIAAAWVNQFQVDDASGVIIPGNLTVQGVTTFIETTNTQIKDANIEINKGGDDASSEGAGLTIERTGTNGSIVYEDALTSKFKAGALGSEVELTNINGAQTLTNKTMAYGDNTFTGFPSAGSIEVEDEGSSLTTAVSKFNFVGDGVAVSEPVADEVTVTIEDSHLTVEDEGTPLSTATTKLNFAGAGVTVTEPSANEMLVTIPGTGGGGSVASYTDTVTPDYLDDTDSGYNINDLWTNTISKTPYICVDNSSGGAVWANVFTGEETPVLEAIYDFTDGSATDDDSGNGYTLTNTDSLSVSASGVTMSYAGSATTANGLLEGTTLLDNLTGRDLAIESYFNISSLPSIAGYIFNRVDSSANGAYIRIDPNGKVTFRWRESNNTTEYTTPSAIGTGTLHHVIYVWSTTQGAVLYINGTNVFVDAAKTTPIGNAPNLNGFTIGASQDPAYGFNGVIEYVRVYNTDLTAAQANTLYTNR